MRLGEREGSGYSTYSQTKQEEKNDSGEGSRTCMQGNETIPSKVH
jgi:hypothetical protein